MLRLPADKQEVAAELLEQLASSSDPYPLSDEARAIVRDALPACER